MKKLFTTAFLQVFFVACSTHFLAEKHYSGAFVSGFLISLLWSGNVKKIAIGGMNEHLVYAAGAAFGSVSGLYISSLLV